MKSRIERIASILTMSVCVGACVFAFVFLIAGLALEYPRAAAVAGAVVVLIGLWLSAWDCGRRFEREHGRRACGAKPYYADRG